MDGQNSFPDEWLAGAFAVTKDCPKPESYLEQVSRKLTEAERERNDRHAEECPVCATERDLARSFDSAGDNADVDYVVSKLEERRAWLPAGRDKSPFALRALPVWAMAAAALVVLGVLGVLRPTGPEAPGLPAFGNGAVTRGSHVEVVQPLGDLEAMPGSLSWRPVADAKTYRVRLMRVDDTVLWETRVDGPSVELTTEVADNLSPRVAYLWQVEALNDSGARVALSDQARFRVVPPAVDGSEIRRQGEERP